MAFLGRMSCGEQDPGARAVWNTRLIHETALRPVGVWSDESPAVKVTEEHERALAPEGLVDMGGAFGIPRLLHLACCSVDGADCASSCSV